MKTVLAKYNPTTGEIEVPDAQGGLLVAQLGIQLPVKEYEEPKQATNIVELVAAGMTADDIIKLKHGGVL